MSWRITKNDVKKAADVLVGWFTRVSSGSTNEYINQLSVIVQTTEDNVVSIIAKLFNLQAEEGESNGFSAPAPHTFEEMAAVMPGLTREDVEPLTDVQCQLLVKMAKAKDVVAN